ncbi:hypothetical protein G4B84_006996 [Aspergillus flavus NRRL3357]|nr:uncharacterized protein G4B84_006996 [Aspergillus flavus NRRL3357]QMW31615.1 hypothetical protein G4B84_006996 [Aspergillus flavus NRRL3357]
MAPGPSVPLEIKYANASDLGALVSIEIRSFPSSNYMRSTYKGCDPLAVHTFKTVCSLEHFAKSDCHILAGVDSETGETIAYSRWNIPAIYGVERAVDTSLSIDAQAQMQNAWAYAPKLNKGTYTFYEEMIKRRSAFLKWGIEKADASNARIYLEATMEGVPAYLKHGWKIIEEIRLEYTERGGEGSQTFALMIREPQGTGF